MGQKLCCLKPSAADQQSQPINASRKPRNLRHDDRTRRAEYNKMMTLDECLKNSPAAAAANHRPQPKKRVFPSTSSPETGNTPYFTPRLSFSSSSTALLGKTAEAAQPCRSYGGGREKSKKKVTFRLPEADDIILFYSPKQGFDTLMEINE